MKRKRVASILGASLLSVGTMFAPTVPVFAADTKSGGSASEVSGGTMNIQKYLVVNGSSSDVLAPTVRFNFTIEGVESSCDSVFSGNDETRVEGTPTIGDAYFRGDKLYNSVQDMVKNAYSGQVADGTKDAVTLGEGQSYARQDIFVNFTNVKFKDAGIYRYKITESESDTRSKDAGRTQVLGVGDTVTNDENNTRYLDVYVVRDENDNLSVQGYVVHATDSEPGEGDKKSEGFVNTYNSKDVKIEKKVSGNQASHSEYFEFNVEVNGALPNTAYYIDYTHASSSKNKTKYLNTDSEGNANATILLKHGEYITIKNLSIGSYLRVGETTYGTGYTTEVNSTDKIVSENLSDSDSNYVRTDGTKTGLKVDKEDDDVINITYTNTKNGTIPTGVVMTVAPFAAVTLLGTVGAATIVMKKKKSE